MRGAPRALLAVQLDVGIIPAYAGSTGLASGEPTTVGDHPRVCGEHFHGLLQAYKDTGSSPRMRGALDAVGSELRGCGIIPAYAGSTSTPLASSPGSRDHPRVCGEHERLTVDAIQAEGSSPRMRGALRLHELVVLLRGIIPAYAGSTYWYWARCERCWDHPRVCGEHVTENRRV